jgi:uncharacterized protein YjbI with pentapeptide repeats
MRPSGARGTVDQLQSSLFAKPMARSSVPWNLPGEIKAPSKEDLHAAAASGLSLAAPHLRVTAVKADSHAAGKADLAAANLSAANLEAPSAEEAAPGLAAAPELGAGKTDFHQAGVADLAAVNLPAANLEALPAGGVDLGAAILHAAGNVPFSASEVAQQKVTHMVLETFNVTVIGEIVRQAGKVDLAAVNLPAANLEALSAGGVDQDEERDLAAASFTAPDLGLAACKTDLHAPGLAAAPELGAGKAGLHHAGKVDLAVVNLPAANLEALPAGGVDLGAAILHAAGNVPLSASEVAQQMVTHMVDETFNVTMIGEIARQAHRDRDGLLSTEQLVREVQRIAEADPANPDAAANIELMELISRVVQGHCKAAGVRIQVHGPFVAEMMLRTDYQEKDELRMVLESKSMQQLMAARDNELHLFVFSDGSAGMGCSSHWAALAYMVSQGLAFLVNTDPNAKQTERVAVMARKLLLQIEKGLSLALPAGISSESTEQPFPTLCYTEGDLTLIGTSSNNANTGVMFQVQWRQPTSEVLIISGRNGDKTHRVCVMGLPGVTNATIDRFHIIPEFRRSGFGTRVMSMLKNLYRDKGTWNLTVANPRNDAVAWYMDKQSFVKNDMKNLVFALRPTAQMPLLMFQPSDAIFVENSGTLCGYQLGSAMIELAAMKVMADAQPVEAAIQGRQFIEQIQRCALEKKRPRIEGKVLKDRIARCIGGPTVPIDGHDAKLNTVTATYVRSHNNQDDYTSCGVIAAFIMLLLVRDEGPSIPNMEQQDRTFLRMQLTLSLKTGSLPKTADLLHAKLTPGEVMIAKELWSFIDKENESNPTGVWISHTFKDETTSITFKDASRLQPGRGLASWLNDDLMNTFVNMISKELDADDCLRPERCMAVLSSFFTIKASEPRLDVEVFSRLNRWISKRKKKATRAVSDVVAPYHTPGHWSVLHLQPGGKTLVYGAAKPTKVDESLQLAIQRLTNLLRPEHDAPKTPGTSGSTVPIPSEATCINPQDLRQSLVYARQVHVTDEANVEEAHQLRLTVVQILRSRLDTEPNLVASLAGMNNSDGTLSLLDKANNYLNSQCQNSEWLDEPELGVAAESILAASLMIVSHPSGPDESLGGFAFTSHLNPKGKKTMHLLRTNKQHYDVLIPATHSEEQLKSDIHGRALEAAMSLTKVHPKKIKLHTGDEYWIFGMPANGNCGYFATNFLKKVYSPMFQRDGEHFAIKWSRKFEALSDSDVQVARQVGDSFAQFKEVSSLSDGNQLGAYDETTAHGTQMLLHIFKVLVDDTTSLTIPSPIAVIGDLGSGLGNCLYYLSTLSTLQGKTICCVGIEEDQQLHHHSKAISLRLGSQQSVSMMMCPYENVSSFNGLDAVMLYEGHAGSSFTMTERHFKMILTILRSKTVQIFSSTKLQSNLESIFRARSSEFETALTDWQVIRLETNIGRSNNRPQTYLYVRKQAIFAPDARLPWGRDTVEADSDMRITNLVTAARLRGIGLLWTVDVEVNNTKAKKLRSKDLVDGSKIGMISGKIKFQCCLTSLVVVPGCAVTARGNITGVFVGVCYHSEAGMHEISNESAFRNPADLILQVKPSSFRVISQMDLVSVDNISPLETVLPADVKAGWEMYLLCKETSNTMREQDIEARRSRRIAEVQIGIKRAREAEETDEAKGRKKSEEAEKAAFKSAAAAEKESLRIVKEREALFDRHEVERVRERRRADRAESQRVRRAEAKLLKQTNASEPSDDFEDQPDSSQNLNHNAKGNGKRLNEDAKGTGTPGNKSWSSSEFEDSFRKFIQTHNPENVKRHKGDTDGTGTPGNNSWSRSSADGTGTPGNNRWSSSSADGTESDVNESVMNKIVGVVTDALLPLQSRLQELTPLHGKLEVLLHEKDITLKAKRDEDVRRWVQELQSQSNEKMERLLTDESSRIRAQIEAKDATAKEARKAAERLKEKKDATAERLKEEDATREKFESMRLKMDQTLDKALGNFDVMRALHDLTNQVKATQLQDSQRLRSEDWSRN